MLRRGDRIDPDPVGQASWRDRDRHGEHRRQMQGRPVVWLRSHDNYARESFLEGVREITGDRVFLACTTASEQTLC